jgi:NAD+ diphosphatase
MAGEISGGGERLLFLGLWKDVAVFALDIEGPADPADGPLAGLGRFEDLRSIALTLTAGDAAILATAKGVFEWRRRHRHCAVCGAASEAAEGGWKRICPSCNAEHFPRTDPVVIMLPVNGERCLLGRQAAWPKGVYSALAGFLEPGESIEEACARELSEEAGLKASAVRYHSTQPWPYPSSLMIGLIAQVEDGEATPDQTELDEVRWFTRDEAGALIRGELADARAPGAMAIAHQLIKAWASGG